MSVYLRHLVFASVVGIAVLALGCDCDEDNVHDIADFDDCNSNTCGWSASDPGRVDIVETIHVSQRGMLLRGPVSVTLTIGRDVEEFQLVSSCPRDIRLIVGYTGASSSDEAHFVMQPTNADDLDDPWHLLAVVVREDDDPAQTIDTLTISNVSGDDCIIDNIRGLTTVDGCEEEDDSF